MSLVPKLAYVGPSIGRHDRGRKKPIEDLGNFGDAVGILGLADPPGKGLGNKRGGTDRSELGRQPGIYRLLATCHDHGDAEPFLPHRTASPAVEQDRPKSAVVGHIGAQGFKPGLVAFSVAYRQGQLVKVRDLVFGNPIEQRLFAFVMTKERGVVNFGFGADVADADLVEGLALEKCQHGFLQRLARTQSTRMGRSR